LPPTAPAEDVDPVKIAILVDGMANRGANYDAAELHSLGPDGLAAVIDHLLPDTAPPPKPALNGPPEAEIRRLIARLDADEFFARDVATQELIDKARGRRDLIHEAARSQSLEIRMRAERVLASWDPRYAERLNAYLSGFWTYLEGISDSPRLQLLAERTMKAFEQGMPEGDRLHLLRLCIAGVAHGHDDASCDILRPLVRHDDERLAVLVTETVGAYKTSGQFVPELLVDALASRRTPVVEVALRFVIDCQDEKRRESVDKRLRAIFDAGDEPLKFQACLPLARDFHDSDAWIYILDQTASTDDNRVRTALNWIGDTKNCGREPAPRLSERLESLLASKAADQRRAAVGVLGTFASDGVARRLIELLADANTLVARQAETSLAAQPDWRHVQDLLMLAATNHKNIDVRVRAERLLPTISKR
jgi:hypothetical protein